MHRVFTRIIDADVDYVEGASSGKAEIDPCLMGPSLL
jgi:hypothetical protein